MKVGLYVRVSTDIQAREGDSIPAQLSALRNYAKEHNHEVVAEFVDDGISGTLLAERDELQNLLNYVRQKKIDLILFTRLDRWFRSIRHYLNTQEILDKFGVAWRAIWEQFETQTPQGRFMVNQTLSFAQYESETTSVRINHVFAYKKEKHEVLSGKVPFGYRIEDKHYVVDEENADIVRRAFAMYVESGNMCETLRRLSDTGMPKTQRAFKKLLQNRKYLGEAYGYDDYLPPIIDKQTFETVQHMLSMNVKINHVNNYVFTGLVWCSDCKRKMTGTTDKYKGSRYKVYRCMYHYRPVPSCDNTNGINEKKLEKFLVKNLEGLAFAELNEKESLKRDSYEKQIASLEKKLKRLKDLYINELISLDEYKHDVADYTARISDFRQKANKTKASDKTALKQLVGMHLDQWYWTLTEDERRQLWRGVISKIWYGSDKQIRVEFL